MAQEEIIFKVGVDTGDSVQDVNKVGDAIENVGKDAKKTDGSFVNLRKELKQLTIQLQNLDPASKEFETVARRAGQIKEQMRGVADAINDADPEKFGGKFQRTAEGIAGAFSAVTGAQALFGQRLEEIEKQMLKVQGAIALTQGISAMKELRNDATEFAMDIKKNVVTAFQSLTTAEMINAAETGSLTLLQKGYALAVGTSTGAMKAFRIALAATGIGLLVVALGFLVEKMMSYMSSTDDATKAQDRLTASTKRFNDERDRMNKKLNDSIEFEKNYAKAVGASEEKIYEIEKQGFKKREAQRESDYWANLQRIETLKNKKKNALNAENMDLVKSINEEITNIKTKNNDLIDLKYQLQRDEKVLTAQYNTDKVKEQDKKDDEEQKKLKEKNQKILEEIKQANLKRNELENQRIATQETLENEYYDSFKTQQQLEEQAVRDKYFNIIETTKDNETLKLAQQKELDAIAKKYKDATDKEESDRQNNLADKYEEYYNEYYDATTAAYQKEQDAVNAKYFYLIEKAKEYGLSTVELEKKRVEELDKIQTPQKQALQDFKNLYGELSTTIQTSTEIDLNNLKTKHSGELEMLKDNYGEKANYAELEYGLKMRQYNEEKAIIDRQRAFAEFQKKVAIVQTTIDTAKSLSSTIAGATQAAAAGGPAAPFLLASYIATGIATVTTAYAKVKTLLNSPMPSIAAPKMPREMKDGNSATGGSTEQTIQAQSTYKVVVVDSDITKMQDKTKKVNAISTI